MGEIMAEKLDLDALARLASGSHVSGYNAVEPMDVLRLIARIRAIENEVSSLHAARIAYASEFPLTADGEPDVGNIHANIRKLKESRASNAGGAVAAGHFVKRSGFGPWIEIDPAKEKGGTPLYLYLHPAPASKEPVADERAAELEKLVRAVYLAGYNCHRKERNYDPMKEEIVGRLIDGIRAALATAQTWQPIETAPKDGARHLVKCSHIGRCVASESFDIDGNSEGWFLVNDIKVSPTHWMPLPAAPAKPEGV
jgi:hypothetical protein